MSEMQNTFPPTWLLTGLKHDGHVDPTHFCPSKPSLHLHWPCSLQELAIDPFGLQLQATRQRGEHNGTLVYTSTTYYTDAGFDYTPSCVSVFVYVTSTCIAGFAVEESLQTLLTLKACGVVHAFETLPCQAVTVAHGIQVQVSVTLAALAGSLNATLSQRIAIESIAALLAPRAYNSTQENEQTIILGLNVRLSSDALLQSCCLLLTCCPRWASAVYVQCPCSERADVAHGAWALLAGSRNLRVAVVTSTTGLSTGCLIS